MSIKPRQFSFICMMMLATMTYSQIPRNLLISSITNQQMNSLLIPFQSWHPYPTILDQGKWTEVKESLKDFYIRNATQYLGKSWEILSATYFLDFVKNGNRSRYEEIYFAAKGGHNAESHNHNDVGNFIVYADGRPLLIDIGVETYTAKTFSSNRYDIWTMQSQYHNLPTINGVQQKDGKEYHAENQRFSSTPKQVVYSLDIAKAYPPEASVVSWHTEFILDRGKKLSLSENYRLREWKEPVRLNFFTPFDANTSRPGHIILTDIQNALLVYEMSYDPVKFKVITEEKEITDDILKTVWGNTLIRIVLISTDKSLKGQYEVVLKKRLNYYLY